MTYTLLAVIVVLVVSHLASDLARLRRYDWYGRWLSSVNARMAAGTSSAGALAAAIGVPLLAVAIVQLLLRGELGGLPAFLFATLALFYAWGPRDLDRDVHAAATTPPAEQPGYAAVVLQGPLPASGSAMAALVGRAALRRWFGPLLWFVLLGAFGAIAYRLVQLGAEDEHALLPAAQRAHATTLLAWLDWPVVHVMALGMAVATDFDAVLATWRARLRVAGGWQVPDAGMIDAVTASAIKADLQAEDHDEDFDTTATIDRSTLLLDALAVMWRVLVVWLAILALLALASLVA
jgi:AmpE protein